MATRFRLDQDELERVIRRADAIGVLLETHVMADGGIWLGRITREEGAPGSGRRVLEMLCEIADEAEVDIRLVVMEWCDKVVELYRSMGFERREFDTAREEDDYILMIREPE